MSEHCSVDPPVVSVPELYVETGILWLLERDPGVIAANCRGVYPELLPDGADLPAITFHPAGGENWPTFDGSGFEMLRLQIDVHAKHYSSATRLRYAVLRCLNDFCGLLPNGMEAQAQFLQRITQTDEQARQSRQSDEYEIYLTLP